MKKINQSKVFGSYIRELRIKNEIGQRELAKKIGIAASYLNDIKKNKRSAPKNNIIEKLSLILKTKLDLLNDMELIIMIYIKKESYKKLWKTFRDHGSGFVIGFYRMTG